MQRSSQAAFSLLEVVIAAGIFAVAVTVMLALLPALTKQNIETSDTLVAQRLPDNLRLELRRLEEGNFNALVAAFPMMAAPLENGLPFVAARDGSRLHSANYLPPTIDSLIAEGERYYAIEVWQFNQGPLRYNASAAVIAIHVRVSWPYFNPGSPTPTPLAARSQFTFNTAINR